MFGGKSTELLRRLERALIANQDVVAFSKDARYEKGAITTHTEQSLTGHYVESAEDVDRLLSENRTVEVVGIDEVQFFDTDLVEVCRSWALAGKRIICAGLDQDFRKEPFETTLGLMAEAEYVSKMLAICTRCGNPALRNHLKVESSSRIVEGSGDLYEALCRQCYEIINE
jgi:thymidine kinase